MVWSGRSLLRCGSSLMPHRHGQGFESCAFLPSQETSAWKNPHYATSPGTDCCREDQLGATAGLCFPLPGEGRELCSELTWALL